jgi:hypothetical protein
LAQIYTATPFSREALEILNIKILKIFTEVFFASSLWEEDKNNLVNPLARPHGPLD